MLFRSGKYRRKRGARYISFNEIKEIKTCELPESLEARIIKDKKLIEYISNAFNIVEELD